MFQHLLQARHGCSSICETWSSALVRDSDPVNTVCRPAVRQGDNGAACRRPAAKIKEKKERTLSSAESILLRGGLIMSREKIEGFMLGLAAGFLFAHFFKLPAEQTRSAGEDQKKRAPQSIVDSPRRNAIPIGA